MFWVVGVVLVGGVVGGVIAAPSNEPSKSSHSEYSDTARRNEAQHKLNQIETAKRQLFQEAKVELQKFQRQYTLPGKDVTWPNYHSSATFESEFGPIKENFNARLKATVEADLAKSIAWDKQALKDLDSAISAINRIQLTKRQDK